MFMLLMSRLGFKEWMFALSTRPSKYIGDDEKWTLAESLLTRLLEKKYKGKWQKKEGDGAFYG